MSTAAAAIDARPPSHADVGRKTLGGMAWLMTQTLGSKLAAILGQIVLARLLVPSDWGLIGLTYTVSIFVSTGQQLGVREILIRRHRNNARWTNASFWICMASGVVGAAIVAGTAGWWAAAYHEPRLRRLLWAMSVAVLINPLAIVPLAILQSQLRFRLISGLAAFDAIGLTALSVLFAWCGAGAYSLILPRIFINVGRFVLASVFARPRLRMTPQLRRWRYIAIDNVVLFAARAANTVISQGDYVLLGVFHDSFVVGAYYFAFSLSMQTFYVFAVNLEGVLLPGLSKIQDDPERLLRGFLRAMSIMGAVGIPLCVIQAALARPVMLMMFGSKWSASIPVVEVLSWGMAFRMIGWPTQTMLQAQARYASFCILNVVGAAMFLAGVSVASWRGGALAVAFVVSGYFAVEAPVTVFVAIRSLGGTIKDVARIFVWPLIGASVFMALGVIVPSALKSIGVSGVREHLATIACVLCGGSAVYATVMRLFAQSTCGEIKRLITRGRGCS